jgi:hypothetical protein
MENGHFLPGTASLLANGGQEGRSKTQRYAWLLQWHRSILEFMKVRVCALIDVSLLCGDSRVVPVDQNWMQKSVGFPYTLLNHLSQIQPVRIHHKFLILL